MPFCVELAVPTRARNLTSGSSAIISAGGNDDANTNTGSDGDLENSNMRSNHRNASTASTSSCIYLEHIEGCTVREYLEKRACSGSMPSAEDEADFAPDRDSDDEKQDANDTCSIGAQDGPNKRPKLIPSGSTGRTSIPNNNSKTKMTRVDDDAMKVAKEVGTLVADMHNSNIVHGDLTTSEFSFVWHLRTCCRYFLRPA